MCCEAMAEVRSLGRLEGEQEPSGSQGSLGQIPTAPPCKEHLLLQPAQ